MAACLIALGSNLGDRAALMRSAVDQLARLPGAFLVARSSWRETPPVGGPAGQRQFLNGAALIDATLTPSQLLAELLKIESSLGRVRAARWGQRSLDLDILLYGDLACGLGDDLKIPHPRVHFRRFVLEPAVEVAPWMVHPTSGWTVSQLLAQLNDGVNEAAVAAHDAALADALAMRLNERLTAIPGAPRVRRFDGGAWNPGPKVLLVAGAATGLRDDAQRKMLKLPAAGPLVWLESVDPDALVDEAWSVLASAWPAVAAA